MIRVAASLVILFPITAFAQAPKPEQAAPFGWSIEGLGFGQDVSDYAIEVDRKVVHGGKASISIRSLAESALWVGSITQSIKADAYRGKRLRLAGYLKTREVAADLCVLLLEAIGPGRALTFDQMQSRQFKGTTDWTRHEFVLDVPEDAEILTFGLRFDGTGQAWADDLTLDVVDPKVIEVTQPLNPVAHPAPLPSNLDFELAGTDGGIPGWDLRYASRKSYTRRIAEGGAHGGRGFLEVLSTRQGSPRFFLAHQFIVAGPYKGKRVRFRAFLKTEGVAGEASLSIVAMAAGQFTARTGTIGRGAKGDTDWRPQEVVLDVPADAEDLTLSIILSGGGTLGVDDVSLEVVDPAKVTVTPRTERTKADRENRLRERAEATAKLPDRAVNLDFER